MAIALVFVAFGATGCGDDDGTTPGTDAGPRDSGGPRDTGPAVDTGPGDVDGGPGEVDTGVPVDAPIGGGMCTNAADLAAVMMTYGMPPRTVQQHTQQCTLACIASEMGAPRVMCINDCLQNAMHLDGAVTSACTECFAAAGDCTVTNCIAECGADPASPGCIECQCGRAGAMVDCIGMFTACSGIPSDTCAM